MGSAASACGRSTRAIACRVFNAKGAAAAAWYSTFMALAASRSVSAYSYAVPHQTETAAQGISLTPEYPFIRDVLNIHSPPSGRVISHRIESARPYSRTIRLDLSSSSGDIKPPEFKRYDKIQVEVVSFGRLGASVEVIGLGHQEEDCIGEDDPALGVGLILQKEIGYFRAGRGGLDVIVGEVLPAFVENVRDDGRLDISLRDPGGKGKADAIGKNILDRLQGTEDGTLDVGDKSTPEEINAEFPGTSKSAFKKAVAALYKKRLVQPGPYSISLMSAKDPSE